MTVVLDGKVLKKAVEFLNVFRSEAKFKLEDGYLVSRVVDPGNVAMGEVKIVVSATGENVEEFAVDIGRLKDIVKGFKGEVQLDVKDGVIEVRSGKIKYKLQLLAPDLISNVKEINLEHKAKMKMLGSEFKEIITAASKVDEAITFEGDRILSKGDIEEISLFVDEVEGNAKAMYSAAYLKDFAKHVDKGDVIEIKYDTQKPCEITAEGEGITLKMVLAPRIEFED